MTNEAAIIEEQNLWRLKIKFSKKAVFFAVLFIILILTPIVLNQYYQLQLAPVSKNQQAEEKIFVVTPGQPITAIAQNLKKEKLIKNALAFRFLVAQMRIEKTIQYGDFRLSPKMSSRDIALELTHGAIDIWITIPEGTRIEQQAEIIEERLKFGGNEAFNFSKKEYTRLSEEGFMFPDTYLIPKDATAETVANQLRSTFQSKIEGSIIGNSTTNLPLEEVVTIASLIEREAKTAQEKPTIAGIINNRLSLGMPLQIDATVQYAKGYENSENTWWPQITRDDYELVKSPYNTYLNTGLPPAAISNPGIDSIRAVLEPEETDYLYYLHDSEGKIHYAITIEQHNQNVQDFL